jgi:hypothetical protein
MTIKGMSWEELACTMATCRSMGIWQQFANEADRRWAAIHAVLTEDPIYCKVCGRSLEDRTEASEADPCEGGWDVRTLCACGVITKYKIEE